MGSGGKPRNLKENNVRIAMEMIRKSEIFSVNDLSNVIQLSKTTIKKVIDILAGHGLVVSVGKGESTEEGGKRPELFRFNSQMGYVVSAHVMPNSIWVATTDLNVGIRTLEKYDVVENRDLDFIMEKLVTLIVDQIRGQNLGGQLIGLGVALAGLVDSTNSVSLYSPHYPGWGRNVPFLAKVREGVERFLGKGLSSPIFLDCVNRYQALAEKEKGIAVGVENFIIVDALDEGVGSGIVLNGEVKHGAHSLSGEIGHMTLDAADGPLCICGNKGCFEALVSAKRIVSMAKERWSGDPLSSPIPGKPLCEMSLEDICIAAAEGEPLCRELIREVAHWFIIGLGNIMMVTDPELIIIQGQYVKAGGYFLELLREGIKSIGLPDVEKQVRIEYSVMGEDRGVLGAATAVVNDFFANRFFRGQPAQVASQKMVTR